MTAANVGNLKCNAIQLDWSSLFVTLHEVKYIPELWGRLYSLSRALVNGFTFRNKGISICLSKGPVSVTFDKVLLTTNGFVSGMKLSIYPSPAIFYATTKVSHDKRIWREQVSWDDGSVWHGEVAED